MLNSDISNGCIIKSQLLNDLVDVNSDHITGKDPGLRKMMMRVQNQVGGV